MDGLSPGVSGYLLRRLWGAVLVLFAVSLLSFVLIFLSGDPVAVLVPLNARAEDMDNIRRQYSLDQPLPIQYLLVPGKAASGDLGDSFRYRTRGAEPGARALADDDAAGRRQRRAVDADQPAPGRPGRLRQRGGCPMARVRRSRCWRSRCRRSGSA